MSARGQRPGERPIDVREIEMQARGRCEALVRECLPNAVKDGNYLRVGSIAGERGQSLAVTLSGAGRGMWTDYSAGPGVPGGSGDMIGLVEQTKFGGDRGKAVQWLKSWLGLDHLDPGRLATVRAQAAERDQAADEAAAKEAESKKRGARALWLNGQPLTGFCPASRYLEGRGIELARLGAWPGSLRFHAEVWNRDAGVKLPCMLAQMVTPTGVHVATHRTWLARDRCGAWVKADAGNVGVPRGQAKKVLGKSGGAFIPLRKGTSGKTMAQLVRGETLYSSEGIENGLTAAIFKPDTRVIAAYSLRNLGMIHLPAAIERLVIIADRDDGERELEALETAIARHQARGIKLVQTAMPPVGVKDFNDWLRQSLGRAA